MKSRIVEFMALGAIMACTAIMGCAAFQAKQHVLRPVIRDDWPSIKEQVVIGVSAQRNQAAADALSLPMLTTEGLDQINGHVAAFETAIAGDSLGTTLVLDWPSIRDQAFIGVKAQVNPAAAQALGVTRISPGVAGQINGHIEEFDTQIKKLE